MVICMCKEIRVHCNMSVCVTRWHLCELTRRSRGLPETCHKSVVDNGPRPSQQTNSQQPASLHCLGLGLATSSLSGSRCCQWKAVPWELVAMLTRYQLWPLSQRVLTIRFPTMCTTSPGRHEVDKPRSRQCKLANHSELYDCTKRSNIKDM